MILKLAALTSSIDLMPLLSPAVGGGVRSNAAMMSVREAISNIRRRCGC